MRGQLDNLVALNIVIHVGLLWCQGSANFLNRRQLHANYDRHFFDYNQFFHQEKPTANQLKLAIVKRAVFSILCVRGHGALLLCRPGSTIAPGSTGTWDHPTPEALALSPMQQVDRRDCERSHDNAESQRAAE